MPGPSPMDLFLPNGRRVGKPGSKPTIRELPGGPNAASALFANLTARGTVDTPAGYPGERYRLPGGGHVGLRAVSKSGGVTMDVDIPGIPIKKLKFA